MRCQTALGEPRGRASGLVAAVMVGGSLLPWDDGTITLPSDGSGDYQHDVGNRLLGVVLAAVLLTWVHRARMDLRQDDIVMRYMLWSRRIPLSQITKVTAGREGLGVETRDGATYGSPRSAQRLTAQRLGVYDQNLTMAG